MSSARICEAFQLTGVSPAVKLAAIMIGDNWNEWDEYAEVSASDIAEFCCVHEISAKGILQDMVHCGFFSEMHETSPGEWRMKFQDWTPVINSRKPRSELCKSLKMSITIRDEVCVYCGDADGPFHIDHILPRSRGGSDDETNLALACAPCNISKKDRTPEEWGGKSDRDFTLAKVNEIRGQS